MDHVWPPACAIHFAPLIQTIFSDVENDTKFHSFAQTFSFLEVVHICLELIFFKVDYQARIAGTVNGFGSHKCVIKGYISTTPAPFSTEELAQGANLHGPI